MVAERIAVIGCGHVGLIMAAGLAALGHEVIGIDRDAALVEELTHDVVRIREPGLPELVAAGLASGRLDFTDAYEDVGRAGYILLAVDTSQTTAGAADLRSIRAAVRSIAANLDGASPIIINKSTSPIGTGETIEELLGLTNGIRPRIVSNPEFLRQGSAVADFWAPDRIVVGARNIDDAYAVAALYAGLPAPFELILTDLRTAEMIKYVANAFLATRVSFINEIARLCEAVGADVDTVVDGVAPDPRIGRSFFHPGIGYGGSCLPKDVAALRYVGETLGVSTPLLGAVQEENAIAKTSVIRRLRARMGPLEGRTVAVWGLTFKGGTEDTRQSPAMDVVDLLRNEGAVVRAYDPAVPAGEYLSPDGRRLALSSFPTALEAATGADALAVLTDWPEFAWVDADELHGVMKGAVVFDGRNVLRRDAVESAGLAYLGVGRHSRAQLRRRSDR
jgi:UDPglucose 6-dehydrogenase